MVLPNLIHPVSVSLRPISRGTTVYDDDAREPVQSAAHDVGIVVPGQLSSSLRINSQRGARSGRIEGEDGYILFRFIDLVAKGITALHDGDLVTKIGTFDVGCYIHRLEPIGHYSGASTLVKAYIRDRKPAKAG